MKRIITLLSAIAIAGVGQIFAADSSFSYCNGTCDRNNVFHVGNSKIQGAAIRISSEKAKMMKGLKIKSISASFGSSYTTDNSVTLFIGSNPANPEYTQTVKISRALKWLDFELDSPYEIKDDSKDLYIGFTGEIDPSTLLLMHDGTDAPAGHCYALDGTAWTDIAGNQWGCPNIKFTVADAPSFTDMMLRPIDTNGYFKADIPYIFSGTIFNFGNETVNSFDLGIKVGDNATIVKNFTGLSIAPTESFAYELDEYTSGIAGKLPIELTVDNINGVIDSDSSDNIFKDNLYFYPAEMERTILLEGFTGQACSNCPEGHRTVNNFIAENPDMNIIEVMHHVGYQPDLFTMAASAQYTYLFGSGNTFAPAMMLNRTLFPSLATVPVMNISNAYLEKACKIIDNTQPYISLSLDTDFNPDTRELNVTVKTFTHNNLPYNNNVIQVFLIQDGIQSYQSLGGSDYTHNALLRGVLTDSDWGKLLPASVVEAGQELSRQFTFTIPDKILSDFWENRITDIDSYMLEAIPENMKVVAFVEALGGEDLSKYFVYNTVEAKLGESYKQAGFGKGNSSGVILPSEIVPSTVGINVANGRIVVDGEYESLAVYSLQGCPINPYSNLTPGIYIINVVANGQIITKKIYVR